MALGVNGARRSRVGNLSVPARPFTLARGGVRLVGVDAPGKDWLMRVHWRPGAAALAGLLSVAACGDGLHKEAALSDRAIDGSGPPSRSAADDAVPTEGEKPQTEVVANPFVKAASDPLSTFAADVDSASYDYYRQSVGLYDSLPGASFVRIEDFVNYFDYDYPAPELTADEPFAIALAAAPHPMGRRTSLLRVGIQAREQPAQEKKPANLVFLVDISGSMLSDDKLPLVQTLLTEALDELEPTDTVAVVTYAGDTAVRLASTPVSQKSTIEAVIRSLEAGGGTAGSSGLDLAYREAQGSFIEGGINHVVLCTDGDFNLGPSSDAELVARIKAKRQSGITLTALGFGHDNLNDSMMEAVSNAGNGMYGVIVDPDSAVAYAHERLLATLVHVAKDMKIQVEFNAAHVLAYRLLGYENRLVRDEDFRDDTVDGGEVGAGHRVSALYELVLAGEKVPAPKSAPALSSGDGDKASVSLPDSELVRVRVRYKAPTASDADPAAEVSEALAPAALGSAPLDGDLAWAAAVATFAEILRGSPYASKDELPAVQKVVAAQRERDKERGEFGRLLDRATELLPFP
jgi:Ca-activated chloride channel family protein